MNRTGSTVVRMIYFKIHILIYLLFFDYIYSNSWDILKTVSFLKTINEGKKFKLICSVKPYRGEEWLLQIWLRKEPKPIKIFIYSCIWRFSKVRKRICWGCLEENVPHLHSTLQFEKYFRSLITWFSQQLFEAGQISICSILGNHCLWLRVAFYDRDCRCSLTCSLIHEHTTKPNFPASLALPCGPN